MNRKTQIGNTCRERVAKAMRFSCWVELIRFQSTQKKTKLNKVAETLIIEEITLQFAEHCVELGITQPDKGHLERFLYEEL